MPRHYFIFDTSALVYKYLPSADAGGGRIKSRLAALFAAKAQHPHVLDFQIPNICMAECAKTFAYACTWR